MIVSYAELPTNAPDYYFKKIRLVKRLFSLPEEVIISKQALVRVYRSKKSVREKISQLRTDFQRNLLQKQFYISAAGLEAIEDLYNAILWDN